MYDIAQVKSIDSDNGKLSVTLNLFSRSKKRERSLELSERTNNVKDTSRIIRTCWVAQPGNSDGDFTSVTPLRQCQRCIIKRQECASVKKNLRRFRTLSLFGGCGGMDIGLSFSHFRTDWMIDMSAIACETFRRHHPSAVVLQSEVGQALADRKKERLLPSPGEVDAIVMGPPCQSFSKMVSRSVLRENKRRVVLPNFSKR